MNDEIAKALSAPLDRRTVRDRTHSGRKLSYIEGWHAIAEANRIFGFDGWTRETVEIKCVAEGDRKIGQAGVPGFAVTYIAKVRVTAAGTLREGYGTGHGIDRDLGLAHESALKEAETDAMKRALMTFGNPFGLALYDKTQANVVDGIDEVPEPVEPVSQRKSSAQVKREDVWPALESSVRACETRDELTACWKANKEAIASWPAAWREQVDELFQAAAAYMYDREIAE